MVRSGLRGEGRDDAFPGPSPGRCRRGAVCEGGKDLDGKHVRQQQPGLAPGRLRALRRRREAGSPVARWPSAAPLRKWRGRPPPAWPPAPAPARARRARIGGAPRWHRRRRLRDASAPCGLPRRSGRARPAPATQSAVGHPCLPRRGSPESDVERPVSSHGPRREGPRPSPHSYGAGRDTAAVAFQK